MDALSDQPESSLVIAVCADPPGDIDLLRSAARLSVDLNLPLLKKPMVRGIDVLLVVTPARLELRVVGGDKMLRGGRAVCVDLLSVNTTSHAGSSFKQPIAKAVGLKRKEPAPTVIDATAGYGEDGWLLASLGCRVLAAERHKVIATLLRDGLLRAAAEVPEAGARLTVVHADALWMFRRMARRDEHMVRDLPDSVAAFLEPEVIYLDPMFPAGRKTAERKPMRLLRLLVGQDADATELWRAAMKVARRRVVVKRPIRAEPLGDKPTVTHKGKSLRYDVYAMG